ncbi:MAG: hypothetical protein FWC26_14335 [Fibromonadales bacterium]|nr:hypothetical protein [Fibromonadales bacterium]
MPKVVVFRNKPENPVCLTPLHMCLENYTQFEIDNFSNSTRIKIAKDKGQIRSFIKDAMNNINLGKKMLLGKIGSDLAQKIYIETNIDLLAYNLELRSVDIRHIFDKHGNEKTERLRGQRAVTIDDVLNFTDIILNFDSVKLDENDGLIFEKNTNEKVNAVTLYTTGNKSLSLKTMWINKKKEA